jgi:hypothetical protein
MEASHKYSFAWRSMKLDTPFSVFAEQVSGDFQRFGVFWLRREVLGIFLPPYLQTEIYFNEAFSNGFG